MFMNCTEDRIYYHLAGNKFDKGSTILKGNYARHLKSIGWDYPSAMREIYI